MLSKKKTIEALDEMAALFPNAECELLHQNVFQLLIATLLSAQATDVSVNKVTPGLFRRFATPEAFLAAPLEAIMQEIKTIGLYRNKAANIQKCCKMLLEDFGGEVPRTLEELTKLPGVGRKTANVVMSVGFQIPAIAVDTHVERISKRLRIAPQKASVLEVEELLMKKIPKERWSDAHHQMIFFGRYHCTARNPKCDVCPLLSMCQEGQKRLGLK
ncbi:endonuclease III [Trichococcus paludicola]|uniref:endonuclease III n=1 Tax=Trichococcus paludicola TaxID=2052942 RepID=UPI000D3C9E39|nr:endonuclease III [Trichococcus paludicola]